MKKHQCVVSTIFFLEVPRRFVFGTRTHGEYGLLFPRVSSDLAPCKVHAMFSPNSRVQSVNLVKTSNALFQNCNIPTRDDEALTSVK